MKNSYIRLRSRVSLAKGVGNLSEQFKVDPEKTREMQERNKERNLIAQEIRNRGASTVEELAKTIGMDKTRLFRHLIAMRQFGKILIVGERDNQLVYGLPQES